MSLVLIVHKQPFSTPCGCVRIRAVALAGSVVSRLHSSLVMRSVLALLVVAACGGTGSSVGKPDGSVSSDGSSPSDGPPTPHGLLVSWTSNPSLPGQIKNDLIVTSARFEISRLQVIGDSGTPMTPSPITLSWSDETTGDPATLGFSSAPGGLYSQIAIELERSGGNSYEIRGTTKVNGVTKPFFLHDSTDIQLDITSYAVVFSPGSDAVLPIRVDLQAPLGVIDFAAATEVGGTLDLGPSDPQMTEVRDRLDNAFKHGP